MFQLRADRDELVAIAITSGESVEDIMRFVSDVCLAEMRSDVMWMEGWDLYIADENDDIVAKYVNCEEWEIA